MCSRSIVTLKAIKRMQIDSKQVINARRHYHQHILTDFRRSGFLFIVTCVSLCLICIFVLPRNHQQSDEISRLIQKYRKNAERNAAAAQNGQNNKKKAVLCCISKDEEPYIDEWADFHLGLGFSQIVVYDNTELFELQQWAEKRRGKGVEVIHYPGKNMQGSAYLECAKKANEYSNTWAAFWDVDEFLVLKKHVSVTEFLSEHLTEGGLAVNWLMFPPSTKVLYEPLPVTKRFVYSDPNDEANMHVKGIARLQDVNMTCIPHVHFPCLKRGHVHNTNGINFDGPFHPGGPTDVAVLHHYQKKSLKEYLIRAKRGRADEPLEGDDQNDKWYEQKHREYLQRVALANNALENALANMTGLKADRDGYTYDDSAWTLLKRVVPKYALYDVLDT